MKWFSLDRLQSSSVSGKRWFAAVVTSVFLVLAGLGATRHEFWRDEMQAWLIARDVPDLPALIEQAHYEGAPPLWSLLLRPLTLVTHRPEAAQVLTWALAGITIFLFCFYAPFNRLQKVLLIGNYYLLFQYGMVCRNYLPGVLLLATACILCSAEKARPWAMAAVLTGAAMASIHSLIVAVAIAAAFWGSRLLGAMHRLHCGDVLPRHLLAGMALVAGVCLAVYSMFPRPDTLYGPAHGWDLGWNPARFSKVAWAFVSSHFPLPRPPGYFWIPPWDTPFQSFDPETAWLLAGALFAGGILVFQRQVGALLLYLVGTLGVAGFLYTKYLGFYRHTGFLFFTFLFAFWLLKAGDNGPRRGRARWTTWLGEIAFTAMLATQALTGLWALREDWERPFSCGKAAAEFLVERGLAKTFLAVGPDWAGSPLAGYLDRLVYYPQGQRYGSFTRWEAQREEAVDDEFFLLRAKARCLLLIPWPVRACQTFGLLKGWLQC